jgi:O-antigen ligase
VLEYIKLGVFICALLAAFCLSKWLRQNPYAMPKIFFLIGALPFLLKILDQPLYITLDARPGWPSLLIGAEFSLIDVLSLAIYFSLPSARHTLPFRFPMLLYFSAVFLSVFQSDVRITALFYCWQLARIFLLYVVVVRACADERVPPALMSGMTVGLCIQTVIELYQHLFLGELRVGGTVGHENLVGIMTHFVIFPMFALLLAGQRGWHPVAAPLIGMLSSVLTVSRAAIGLNAVGFVFAFVLFALKRWTPRMTVVALLGLTAFAGLSPIALSSIEQRNANQRLVEQERSNLNEPRRTEDVRVNMNRAAAMIVEDHPMGIGANNYIRIANIGGYNIRAGVPLSKTMLAATVHNIYWLVAAETGYFGICTFVIMLLGFLVTAFKCGWRNQTDRRGSLLLGFGVVLLVLYVHSWFEFALVLQEVQYPFAIIVGLVSGLAIQLGYWRPRRSYGARIGTDTASITA